MRDFLAPRACVAAFLAFVWRRDDIAPDGSLMICAALLAQCAPAHF